MSKNSLHLILTAFCQNNRYELIAEYRFYTKRRWKADYFIPELNLLIEYEGIGNGKGGIGGHQTLVGFTNNCDKYNRAALLGFRMLRYTTKNVRNAIDDLDELNNSLHL